MSQRAGSGLILFVRHGLADYRPGYLYGWKPGVHLSPQGRDEAKALAGRLEAVGYEAVYSSPLERCLETAELIAEVRGLQVLVEDDLGEVRYGSWQGRSFKSLRKTRLWHTVQFVPSRARFPGGESVLELQHRGLAAVEAIRTAHRRPVVVVSHADMIKVVAAHYLGMHLDLFQRLEVGTASVTAVSFAGEFPRVLRVGDTGDYSAFSAQPPGGRKDRGGKRQSGGK